MQVTHETQSEQTSATGAPGTASPSGGAFGLKRSVAGGGFDAALQLLTPRDGAGRARPIDTGVGAAARAVSGAGGGGAGARAVQRKEGGGGGDASAGVKIQKDSVALSGEYAIVPNGYKHELMIGTFYGIDFWLSFTPSVKIAAEGEYARKKDDPDHEGAQLDANVITVKAGVSCAGEIKLLAGKSIPELGAFGPYGASGIECSSAAVVTVDLDEGTATVEPFVIELAGTCEIGFEIGSYVVKHELAKKEIAKLSLLGLELTTGTPQRPTLTVAENEKSALRDKLKAALAAQLGVEKETIDTAEMVYDAAKWVYDHNPMIASRDAAAEGLGKAAGAVYVAVDDTLDDLAGVNDTAPFPSGETLLYWYEMNAAERNMIGIRTPAKGRYGPWLDHPSIRDGIIPQERDYTAVVERCAALFQKKNELEGKSPTPIYDVDASGSGLGLVQWDPVAQGMTVQDLEERIERLSEEIAELEAEQAKAPVMKSSGPKGALPYDEAMAIVTRARDAYEAYWQDKEAELAERGRRQADDRSGQILAASGMERHKLIAEAARDLEVLSADAVGEMAPALDDLARVVRAEAGFVEPRTDDEKELVRRCRGFEADTNFEDAVRAWYHATFTLTANQDGCHFGRQDDIEIDYVDTSSITNDAGDLLIY